MVSGKFILRVKEKNRLPLPPGVALGRAWALADLLAAIKLPHARLVLRLLPQLPPPPPYSSA